jgi:hypothetical protein
MFAAAEYHSAFLLVTTESSTEGIEVTLHKLAGSRHSKENRLKANIAVSLKLRSPKIAHCGG